MPFTGNGSQLNDAFSGRPNISLRLNTSEAVVSGTNRSTISWNLQLVETASQPSFNLNANSTASLTFTLGSGVTLYSGDRTPAIANYTYDFRATGNQTKTIGSGSFVVTHTAAGGGTIQASASATDGGGNLGSASIPANSSSIWTLIDIDTTPNTPSAPTVTQNGNGSFTIALTNPGTANGGPATSIYYQIYNVTTGGWDSTLRTAGTISLTATSQYQFRSVAQNSEATEYSANTGTYAGVPNAPTFSAITRSGRTISVTVASGGTNGAAITSYTTQREVSGSGIWVTHNNSDDLLPETTYRFRTTANSSVGSSATTTSGNYNIPSLPVFGMLGSITKTGRKLNIDWTAATADTANGSSISGYEIFIANSSDSYATWTSLGTTTSLSFQTADQTLGRGYNFRVYVLSDVNSSSVYTVFEEFSSPFFLSAFGYRHDGTNFDTAIVNAERFNGTAWVPITSIEISNGTTFSPLTS
jgi:hypothetical protein